MSKLNENYFKTEEGGKEPADIASVIGADEKILWRGKPKKSVYIAGRVLSMLPFALLWLAFDGTFIAMLCIFGSSMPLPFIIGICVFFAFHLAPVWIWIANVVTANRQHKNLEYAFTDRRIIVKSGIIGIDFKNIFYADIGSVNLRVGIIDKICKTGDIYIKSREGATVLYDLENPYFLVERLQKITLDLKMDASYPNELRPKTNSGFGTEYTAGEAEQVGNAVSADNGKGKDEK